MIKSNFAQNIQVIILGRSLTGKSVFIDNLIHCLHYGNLKQKKPVSVCGIFSSTNIPSIKTIVHSSRTIEFVDTRGSFESVPSSKCALNNAAIMLQNNSSIPNKNGRKRIVFFTLVLDEGINHDDIETMESYADIINDKDSHCAIILTRSEKHSEETNLKFIEEFENHMKNRNKINLSKLDSFCSGALDECNAKLENSMAISSYVEEMTKSIIEFIME